MVDWKSRDARARVELYCDPVVLIHNAYECEGTIYETLYVMWRRKSSAS